MERIYAANCVINIARLNPSMGDVQLIASASIQPGDLGAFPSLPESFPADLYEMIVVLGLTAVVSERDESTRLSFRVS